MAIGLRAFGTPVTTASRTSTVIPLPAGAAAGDEVRVVVNAGMNGATAPTISHAGAASLVATVTWGDGTYTVRHSVYRYRMTGSGDPSSLTFTHASAVSDGVSCAWTGVDATTPDDAAAVTTAIANTGSAAGQAILNGITTVTADALLLVARGSWDGNAITPPSGWTEHLDQPITWIGSSPKPTTGATGTISIPAGNGPGVTPASGILMALRPAAGTTRVTKTVDVAWNTAARVTKSASTTWNVAARAVKMAATVWQVLARAAKTAATAWNVAARASMAAGSAWNVAERVTKTTQIAWSTEAAVTRVTVTADVAWQTRQRATTTAPTTWGVLARSTTAAVTAWHIRSRQTVATPTAWDVRARGILTAPTTWNTLSNMDRAAVTAPVAWNVAERRQTSRPLGWQVLERRTITTLTGWATAEQRTTTRPLGWTVFAPATATCPLGWSVMQRAALARPVAWNVGSDGPEYFFPDSRTLRPVDRALVVATPQRELRSATPTRTIEEAPMSSTNFATVKRGDSEALVDIRAGGIAQDLTGATLRAVVKNKATGADVMTTVTPSGPPVAGRVAIATAALDVGDYLVEIEVTIGGKLATFPSRGQLLLRVTADLG